LFCLNENLKVPTNALEDSFSIVYFRGDKTDGAIGAGTPQACRRT
jgi:hypothetical protein